MAVVIAVGLPDWVLFAIRQDEGGSHIIRKIADINLCRNKLHGNIIADIVNGNSGIFPNLTGDAVVKTVIQPLPGLGPAGMISGSFIAFKRDIINPTMEGCVVGTHVIFKHTVKLSQRGNGIYIQSVKPTLFERTEMAFHLAFVM